MATVHIGKQNALNLGERIEYFADSQNTLSLEQIKQLSDNAWSQSQEATPNFGYTDSAYWFRFRMVNSELKPLQALLAIAYPLLDHIEVYMFEQGQLLVDEVTGDTYPFVQRPLRHRDFLFPITMYWDTPIDVYIKVKSQGAVQLPLTLWNAKQFALIDQDEQLIKILYYGMLLLLMIYNLFLFLSIRELPYLFYVGLVGSVMVLMAGTHGYLYQYVYPESPYIQNMSMLLAAPGVCLFASLFASHFLRLRDTAPRLYMLLSGFALVFITSMVGAFFLSYHVSTQISVFMAIPASVVIMFVGPYAWIKGQTSARYFIVAWFFLMSGIFVTASSKFGFLPRNGFTEYALTWGSALEAILLSFALADRFNRERLARFQEQKEKLLAVEERKQAEQKLYHQATHQPVDGLPNMVLFQQCLHKLLHSEDKTTREFTLVFIHLSRLLEINKTLGHANADIILSLFSRRLEDIAHEDSQWVSIEDGARPQHFAHLEGVIYAAVLTSADRHAVLNRVHDLRMRLVEPVEFNSMELDLGVSVGMASFPGHGKDIATLIRHARVAVDHADSHPERVALYHDEINPYSARRLTLMGELSRAIQDDALALYYQPITCPRDGSLVSFEALLRWDHPSLGFIPPDEFISLAENTGLIRPLTNWVLERAVRELSSLNCEQSVSVNISVVNLQERDFVHSVSRLLEKNELLADRLILEITETAVMRDPEQATTQLRRLADLGVNIAIDDFGTGHSSLAYMRQLPLYEVKVDRSFVMQMTQHDNDQMIVRAAINLCHELGFKVVAEGVEDEAALCLLDEFSCDFAQGYHIARPMPFSDLQRWLNSH